MLTNNIASVLFYSASARSTLLALLALAEYKSKYFLIKNHLYKNGAFSQPSYIFLVLTVLTVLTQPRNEQLLVLTSGANGANLEVL